MRVALFSSHFDLSNHLPLARNKDISASMNHDAKGTFMAPNSPDHAASSLKKARGVIPPLVVAALKRGADVTIVRYCSVFLFRFEFF